MDYSAPANADSDGAPDDVDSPPIDHTSEYMAKGSAAGSVIGATKALLGTPKFSQLADPIIGTGAGYVYGKYKNLAQRHPAWATVAKTLAIGGTGALIATKTFSKNQEN